MNKVFAIALGEYGVKGIPGASHSSQILRYFSNIGFKSVKDDETAWCAAFANWCFWKAGLQGTGSLMARSFLKLGKRTHAPKLGDLVVLWRGSKDSIYGHVGFFIKEDKDIVYILGGNQSNAVNVTAFPKTQVLEFRTFADKK